MFFWGGSRTRRTFFCFWVDFLLFNVSLHCSVVILSYLRNAILPKSCFRRLCHSNFVNTLLYITIFCAIPRLHRHRNLSQFLFKQSSASTSTTVAKISNKSLFELFFSGTLKRKLLPLFCQNQPSNTIEPLPPITPLRAVQPFPGIKSTHPTTARNCS